MSDINRAHETRDAKPDLGAAVSEIKTALTGKAEELAGRSAGTGADAVSALGKTAASLAGSLQDQSPAVADYCRARPASASIASPTTCATSRRVNC